MRFYKKIQKENLYQEVIKILNGTLKLTSKEIDILEILIKLDVAWTPVTDNDYKNILSTDSRRIIMKESGVMKSNLIKYTGSLKKKGIIFENEHGGWEVNPILVEPMLNKEVEITYVLDVEDGIQDKEESLEQTNNI